MSLMEFSRPAWWEWPFVVILILGLWMGIPIMLAISLFRDRETREYFTQKALHSDCLLPLTPTLSPSEGAREKILNFAYLQICRPAGP